MKKTLKELFKNKDKIKLDNKYITFYIENNQLECNLSYYIGTLKNDKNENLKNELFEEFIQIFSSFFPEFFQELKPKYQEREVFLKYLLDIYFKNFLNYFKQYIKFKKQLSFLLQSSFQMNPIDVNQKSQPIFFNFLNHFEHLFYKPWLNKTWLKIRFKEHTLYIDNRIIIAFSLFLLFTALIVLVVLYVFNLFFSPNQLSYCVFMWSSACVSPFFWNNL